MKRWIAAAAAIALILSMSVFAFAKEEGFAVEDGRLVYFLENGNKAKNKTIGTFRFGRDTFYTSGNKDLDEFVSSVVKEYTDDSMTQEERLVALYDYMLTKCSYRMGNIYEPGEEGWEIEEALDMIERGNRGNCYSFAALFRELARAIGYPAEAYSGTVKGANYEHERTPHGWVEIEIDGEVFVFDPEMGYMQQMVLFMMPQNDPGTQRWGYRVDAPEKTEITDKAEDK
ncbi:MAG: transglutaminase-like domain-containing protein [Eubacteriales bacterium]|nr:transglutaminase-like domain-containing protein [Eubacteriales bacterium]